MILINLTWFKARGKENIRPITGRTPLCPPFQPLSGDSIDPNDSVSQIESNVGGSHSITAVPAPL